MSLSNYSQRYASTDSQTAGSFAFDTISGSDYSIGKIAFGTLGSVTIVDASNPLPVTISGIATSAKQDTGNTSLSSIDGKIPALGQALAAASVPIVLTAAQITTLTPPAAITGFATESTLSTLNGKVTACNTGAVVLAAGTAAVGKLVANDGVDIGDVTINNASGASAVNIQDGGNSITVDGTVAATQSGTWNVGTLTGITNVVHIDDNSSTISIDDGAGSITVDGTVSISGTVTVGSHAVTNAGTFAVQESGSQVQVDDAAFTPATSKIVMAGAEFDDSTPDSVDEGDGGALRMSANRNLYVRIRDNAGNERGLNIDANGEMQVSGSRNAIAVTDNSGSLTVDYATTGSGNATGALRVELANNGTGVLATLGTITNVVHVDDNSGSLTVDNGGTFAVQAAQSGTWNVTNVSGTISLPTGASTATNQTTTQTPITPATATATKGTLLGVQYNTTQATFTDGQQGSVQCTSRGALMVGTGSDTFNVTVNAALPAGTNGIGKLTANSGVTIGAVEIASAQTLATVTTVSTVTTCSTVTTLTGSSIASGSSDSGNPHKIGAVAHTAAPTAVTDGQRVNLIADKVGKLITAGSIRDLKVIEQTTITSSTSETTIAAAVASTFKDLYGLIITNTSATGTKVTIKDSTSGTTRAVIYVPANDTRGFMLHESAALPQATTNTAWTATCGTSVASIEITALTVKNV
jgi:hypothetical protein